MIDWTDLEKSICVFNEMLGLKKAGVHEPWSQSPGSKGGISAAGFETRRAHGARQPSHPLPPIPEIIPRMAESDAKRMHQRVLGEMRSMPKPKLPG